jgi:hypothetical protein
MSAAAIKPFKDIEDERILETVAAEKDLLKVPL